MRHKRDVSTLTKYIHKNLFGCLGILIGNQYDNHTKAHVCLSIYSDIVIENIPHPSILIPMHLIIKLDLSLKLIVNIFSYQLVNFLFSVFISICCCVVSCCYYTSEEIFVFVLFVPCTTKTAL